MASSSGSTSKSLALLSAAFDGKLRRLKKLVAELDDGRGVAKTVDSIKDQMGRSALHLAALQGKTDICNYLIHDLKLDVNVKTIEKGETPLHLACLGGNFSTAQYLLKKGATPVIANQKGFTPLHYAANIGHEELLHLLLSKGANVDAASSAGTSLLRAAGQGKHEVVKILLDYQANPNVSFYLGCTPLLASISADSLKCLKLLLKAGADPNAGGFGVTPLGFAVSEGKLSMVHCLVKAGADPNVTCEDGLAPIEIAALCGNRLCVQILFPATSPIPAYPNWSFGGILKHVHSKEAIEQRKIKEKEKFGETKLKGDDAFHGKDYQKAIYYYTMAIVADPSNVALLSNRSLCWALLENGDEALGDALACMMLKPNWPKAYYRAGAAWSVLKKFDRAADAFFEGLRLAPGNKELLKAYRTAVDARLKSIDIDL